MPTEPLAAAPLQGRGVTVLLWGLLLLAVAMLIAAWTQPLLTVRVTAYIPALMTEIPILDETRSVITMVDRLLETGYQVIAILIVFFGVLLPVVKNAGVALLLLSPPGGRGQATASALQFMGRFAMVDIFAVSIIVSVMAAGTIGQGQASPVEVTPETLLHSGFYLFVGYVLVSFALDVLLAMRHRAAPPRSGRN